MSPASAPSSSGRASGPGLLRAAAVGLCGGLLIGGLALLWVGIRGLRVPPDCGWIPKEECQFITETALEVGRVQTICGGALVALSLAVYVLLRPYLQPRAEGTEQQ